MNAQRDALLRITIWSASLLTVSGCQQQDVDLVREVFGDQRTFNAVSSASEVQGFLIDGTDPRLQWGVAKADDYPISKGPLPIQDQVAAELISSIKDEQTYLWNLTKACLPTPGVRVQIMNDDQRVDVLFCFECDMLGVYRAGDFVGGGSFDHGRPTIVKKLKEVFPDSPVVQDLSEER